MKKFLDKARAIKEDVLSSNIQDERIYALFALIPIIGLVLIVVVMLLRY